MRYSLRQLQVFIAIAHHENLSRAAEELAMSQSAASSALKEFEQQVGVQLFDRVGKRLQLNEQGRALRPKGEALLAQALEFEQSLLSHAQPGPLNVGATLSIGNYVAVGLMAQYMSDNRQALVHLHVANMQQIVDKVLNFELDIGLIEGDVHHPNLKVFPWMDDQLEVFCHPNDPLATKATLTDEDILNAKWILREPGSATRQTFERAMHGILPQLNVALELQHTEAIKRAVEAQLGISCLSSITLKDAFDRGSLIPLWVPQRDFKRQFYIIVHQQKFISAGIQRWIDLCQAYRQDSSAT